MRRLLILLAIASLALGIWASATAQLPTWSDLSRNHLALTAWVAANPALAAGCYVLAYTASTALALPLGSLLSTSAGFLFGALFGTLLAVLGATAGATLLFLVIRTTLAPVFERRFGARAGALRARLRRDGFSYLLALRLTPIFPFWLVNLSASLCGLSLQTYVTATALGILPVSAVLAWTGAGIGTVLAAGGQPDLGIVFSFPVLGPLLALGALSLIPVLWRRDA